MKKILRFISLFTVVTMLTVISVLIEFNTFNESFSTYFLLNILFVLLCIGSGIIVYLLWGNDD